MLGLLPFSSLQWGGGGWMQDLAHARQALFHWAPLISKFVFLALWQAPMHASRPCKGHLPWEAPWDLSQVFCFGGEGIHKWHI